MDIPVRKAVPAEAKELAAFAEACFIESFGYLFPEQALDHVCRRAFGPDSAAVLIERGAWVAEGASGWVGYAALGAEPCPIPGLGEPHVQLARLYVAGPWQGRGVSGALMTAFLDEARRRRAQGIWLEAFEGNPRALGFYKRWGFRDIGGRQVEVRDGVHLPHRILGKEMDQG